MAIFSEYSGNTMLNNALQCIQVMASLEHVSQVTPEILLKSFNKYNLPKLYQRMKNYTMIFTRNGPLLNDTKFGEKIYRQLFEKILNSYEDEGDKQCEISGLRFNLTFSEMYTETLLEIGIDPKSRDTSINRGWWPLIGALGSDAQALPGAKFAVQIHPICLAIIQFLPLAAVLYRSRVLLIESVNFAYAKSLVRTNYRLIQDMIATTSLQENVENKKYSKPEYLVLALDAYHRLTKRHNDYTNLNFWMFSNSGTGAACDIDRIPNTLFQKMYMLYSRHPKELKDILASKSGFALIDCLDANEDFWGLYPAKKWEGASVGFFEDFHKLIDNDGLLKLSGYIAGLMDKYQTLRDEKLLKKTDAFKNPEYRDLFFAVLMKAVQAGEWNLLLHNQILDDAEAMPVKSGTFNIFKMVHFYFQKQKFKTRPHIVPPPSSTVLQVCRFFIDCIENDALKGKFVKNLMDPNNFLRTNLNGFIIRAAESMDFNEIYAMLYEEGRRVHYGILTLLRLYFSSQEQIDLPPFELKRSLAETLSLPQKNFLEKYQTFAKRYGHYYTIRYGRDAITFPISKFQNHVLHKFPKDNSAFHYWIKDIRANMKQIVQEEAEVFDLDELLHDENGEYNLSFARFATEFSLNKLASEWQNEPQLERNPA